MIKTIDSSDRIYTDMYGAYTGQTIYYRIDDYFDNQIYPTSGTYETLSITITNQFEDIPIDWYSFSVKNMNHSIVKFLMTNGSRTYPQFLYPYEPFYWDVLEGEYTINLTYYNPVSGAVVDYHQENITITGDTYYWIRGYDLRDIIIEITAVNATIDTIFLNIDVDLSLINSNVTYLNSIISEIWNSQNTSFGSVNSVLVSFWDNQNTSFAGVNQTILAFWDSQNTNFGNVSSNLMSIWESQNTSFGNVDTILLQVWSAENSSYENITNSITQMWISQNTSFSDINNVIVQFWAVQNSSFDNVSNDITQFWLGMNNSFQDVENHISSMWINFNSTFGSVNQTIISFWNNVNTSFDAVTNTVLNIWDSQNTSFGNVTDTVLSFWNAQNSSFDELTVFINTHLNYINNSINISFIGINTRLDVLYNDMNISFIYSNTLINFSHNSIVQNITSLNLTIYNKMMQILENVEQAGDSVFNKTISVLDNLTQVYINLSDDIVAETLNVIINVTATFTRNTISVLDAIDGVISQAQNIEDIISGLKKIIEEQDTVDEPIDWPRPSDDKSFIVPTKPPAYPEDPFTVSEMYAVLQVTSMPKSDAEITVVFLDTGYSPRMYGGVDLSKIIGQKLPTYASAYDSQGHGTWVSYAFASTFESHLPNARLISFKVFDDEGVCTKEQLIEAFDAVKKLEPDVVSFSGGTYGSPLDDISKKVFTLTLINALGRTQYKYLFLLS